MKRVVIEKPDETVIDLSKVTKEHIIIGYFNDCVEGWFKLQKQYNCPSPQWQWCGLENTNDWCSPCADSIEKAIKQFATEYKNEVYIFDTFEQFLEEFPALVKSKK